MGNVISLTGWDVCVVQQMRPAINEMADKFRLGTAITARFMNLHSSGLFLEILKPGCGRQNNILLGELMGLC